MSKPPHPLTTRRTVQTGLTRWRVVLMMALLLPPGCSLSISIGRGGTASKTLPQPTLAFNSAEQQAATPLRIAAFSGYPTLLVRAGATEGRFILDTGGAGALIVTDAFLQRCGGKRLHNVSTTINGASFPAAVLPPIQLEGGLTLTDATALVSDLEQMQQVCGGMAIDGVLTLGMLKGLELDIDMAQGVVRFRPAHLPVHPPEAVVLDRPAAGDDDPRPYAVLQLGEGHIPVLLDTGHYGAADIPQHLFHAVGAALNDPRPSFGAAGFNSKPSPTQRGRIDHMALGAIQLDHTEAQIIPHDDAQAVIGIAILRHYRVIYNTSARSLLLIGPARLDGAAPDPAVIQLVEQICREKLP